MKNALELTKEHVQPSNASIDMAEALGTKYIVHSIETQKSKFGDIMFAQVSQTEGDEPTRMFIRGSKVQERLEYIKEHDLFPCEATFVKKGAVYEIA